MCVVIAVRYPRWVFLSTGGLVGRGGEPVTPRNGVQIVVSGDPTSAVDTSAFSWTRQDLNS